VILSLGLARRLPPPIGSSQAFGTARLMQLMLVVDASAASSGSRSRTWDPDAMREMWMTDRIQPRRAGRWETAAGLAAQNEEAKAGDFRRRHSQGIAR
jgi:hypothetical protein